MSKLADKKLDILSPRKNKSLVSILKTYSSFHNDISLMSEDNEGLYRTKEGRKKFLSKRKEKGFLKALPMCQLFIPEKSSTMKDMEVESDADISNSDNSGIPIPVADESYKVNIVARELLGDSPILPIEDFDSMSSCGAQGSESSNMGSSCPEMSYLSNFANKASRMDLYEERKSFSAKSHEQNLKRKRQISLIPSPEPSETSSNNTSIESCPSVAKKVKFFPMITSTPIKKRLNSGIGHQRVKKVLEFSDNSDLEQIKLEQNVGESGNSLLLDDTNSILSQSFEKNEVNLALANSSDLEGRNVCDQTQTHPNQSISNLVEKFSSKIMFSMNNSGNVLKRKVESIDSATEPPIYNMEDWSMGGGKYDAKYPAECVTLSANIRLNAIAQEQPSQHSQQYKPLKQSFDDSYKLAPIQESQRKVDDVQSKDFKSAYLLGRHRCMGFDSKIKPKTRLRRRYKSESDLFERSIVVDGRQAVNAPSDAAQEYDEYDDEGDLDGNDKSMDGSNIKLYSLSNPDRSLASHDSGSLSSLAVGQESVMEIFCEQMHDLQMDNT